jgi:hypothetical protein
LSETNPSWSTCWICTGPQPANGSLTPDVWTISLFALSFLDLFSLQDCRLLPTTHSNTRAFLHQKKNKKLEDWQAGNLHQLTIGSALLSDISEHHSQLLPKRPGRTSC